jgi:hypothetical protein
MHMTIRRSTPSTRQFCASADRLFREFEGADTEQVSWVRWWIAIGALVLLVSFAAGTEDIGSVRHQGETYSCGDVLTFDYGAPETATSDRTPPAVAARCRPIHTLHVAGVWGGVGLGALTMLVGWTALREREDADPVPAEPRVSA